MKRQFIILTLFIFSQTVFGQFNIGITANNGLSYLSTKHNFSFSQTTQKFSFVPSVHGGIFCNFILSDKSSLGTEFLFVQIEGKEEAKTPVTDQYGNPTGQYIVENIRRHISYFGIPIYFGYKMKKFTINVGFQILFTLTSGAHFNIQSPNPVIIISPISDKLNIDSYDYGIRTALTFNLTKKFAIESTYYFGLNNIWETYSTDWIWKVQQITVGLRYKFLTTRQKSETKK